MSNPFGTFPINLSSGIMARFGRIELFSSQIVISDPSMNAIQDSGSSTITIELNKIISIELKTWLYFNSKIVITYADGAAHRVVSFAYADAWSTNMYKTVYLYSALKSLRDTGECSTDKLLQTQMEDKVPVIFMFVGCLAGLVIFTPLFGFYGNGFYLIYMFLGSAIFGFPIAYVYLVRIQKLLNTLK